jgi:hypothetical protein
MTAITNWRPLRSLLRRTGPFDGLLREFFPLPEVGSGPPEPAADVAGSDGEVIAELQVPGAEKNHVPLTGEAGTAGRKQFRSGEKP